MNPVVSIIVPVFNAQSCLERCINSIRQQSLSDVEIIAVNDGSTDASMQLLNKLEKIDSRIHVINKTNGGPSSARNVGLKQAAAQYILFVDVDDTIESDMLERMVESAEHYRADIVVCGYNNIIKGEIISTILPEKSWEEYLDKQGIVEKIFPLIPTNKFNPLWNKLYRKRHIDDTGRTFLESICMGEDLLFNIDVLETAKKIAFVRRGLYNYHKTAGSLTNRYIENLICSKTVISKRIRELAHNHNVNCNAFQRNFDELVYRDVADSVLNLVYPGSPMSWDFLIKQLKTIAETDELKNINFEGFKHNSKMKELAVRLLHNKHIYTLSAILLLYNFYYKRNINNLTGVVI